MPGFVQGVEREQATLLPACLDAYMAEDNPVRAVDAFVDALDLDGLGFIHVKPLDIGRPGYIAATMVATTPSQWLFGRIPETALSRRCREPSWLGQLRKPGGDCAARPEWYCS